MSTRINVSRDTREVPIGLVDPDPAQPRRWVDPVRLAELAASIDANGQAVPILLRPAGERFVIVHGERRWRAVQSLGRESIRAETVDLDDTAVRWLQLAENVNRDDLSPLEEARAYAALLDTGVSRDTLAQRLGRSVSYIAQKLRLLDLPAGIALLLDRKALSEGHVRQLLRLRGFYTDSHVLEASEGGTLAGMRDWPPVDRAASVRVILTTMRPEDWPTGYGPFPGCLDPDNPRDLLAADAVIEALVQAEPGGPRWAVTATWFAVLSVVMDQSVADLHTLIDIWAQRIYAAIIGVRLHPQEKPPSPGGTAWQHWWGHRADLRHAGLLDDHAHLTIPAVESMEREGALIAPSGCQPGGPFHDEYRAAQVREIDGGAR